jgi:hypothetical protein
MPISAAKTATLTPAANTATTPVQSAGSDRAVEYSDFSCEDGNTDAGGQHGDNSGSISRIADRGGDGTLDSEIEGRVAADDGPMPTGPTKAITTTRLPGTTKDRPRRRCRKESRSRGAAIRRGGAGDHSRRCSRPEPALIWSLTFLL